MTAYDDGRVSVHLGDCLDVLRTLPDASVDAVVTDPPYGLEFMGKEWDSFGGDRRQPFLGEIQTPDNPYGRSTVRFAGSASYGAKVEGMRAFQDWCELWATECLRVLKPGGHMLAFGGTRTWHRLACAVEDAGFEVRDSLAWLHGQGFPKSMSVSKALGDKGCRCGEVESDRAVDNLRGVRQGVSDLAADPAAREVSDLLPTVQREGARAGVGAPGEGSAEEARTLRAPIRPGQPSMEGRGDVQAAEGELHRPALREVSRGSASDGTGGRVRDGASARHGSPDRATAAQVGSGEPHQPRPTGQPAGESGAVPEQRGPQAGRGWPLCDGCGKPAVTGLGTALKPAFEPVVVARKPLTGTVAANVLAHGTGALNVDGCRVGDGADKEAVRFRPEHQRTSTNAAEDGSLRGSREGAVSTTAGRWPANVVLDESQAAALDEQSGERAAGNHPANRGGDRDESVYALGHKGTNGERKATEPGGASRFFYVAKAPATERPRVDGTAHPTVKPLDLMRWLVRLVTPPGGVVLEPFAGSGTTVEACIVEGFRCIAIEREADYLPLILQRIHRRRDPVAAIRQTGDDLGLFELDGEPA